MDIARETCERHVPGLVKALTEIPLPERETPGSPVIGLFRQHGGPGLLVPARYQGNAIDMLDATRVTLAVGALSPSLAAASTMHHFTVAMLFALADNSGRLTDAQLALLGKVAPESLLLASGWAEGRTEQNILAPSVTATEAAGGYRVNGSKKPCSLSRSMDVLTASVALPDAAGKPSLAVLLVPADVPGVSVHPFWGNPVLAAAESDEVRLEDVFVPDDLVIRTTQSDPDRLDDLQTAGFVWFELLITAGYLGAAGALVELVLARAKGSVTDRAALGTGLEAAVTQVEGTARALRDGLSGDDAVAAVLITRFAVQEAVQRLAGSAVELLGGMAFISSPDVAYLASAVRPLAFHPPSRTSTAQPLVDYFAGGPLVLS
jgi:alkylation response protein AidB-like acyl-CoA dehydrogenase